MAFDNDLDGVFEGREVNLDGSMPMSPPAWTQVGGLSLRIEIPKSANELPFSKIGGAPKLALRIRSKEVISTGANALWAIVWCGVGLTLAAFCLRRDPSKSFIGPIGWLLMVAGVLSFALMPMPLDGYGLVAFIIGALLTAVRLVNARRAVAMAK